MDFTSLQVTNYAGSSPSLVMHYIVHCIAINRVIDHCLYNVNFRFGNTTWVFHQWFFTNSHQLQFGPEIQAFFSHKLTLKPSGAHDNYLEIPRVGNIQNDYGRTVNLVKYFTFWVTDLAIDVNLV